MRELVYYVAVSLDGYIADPRGGYDPFLIGGDHSRVVFDEYADALPGHVLDALGITPPRSRFDTVLMGWNTLTPALDAGIGSPYPHLRQIVASRRARTVSPDLAVTSEPLDLVRELKQEDGLDIWLCGGGALAGSLLPEIDRLVLKRHPLVFGAGIPLFDGVAFDARRFAPDSRREFASGVIVEEYARTRPE
ncbi:dihydrofolate reductase family protein [Microbacterium sp. ARD31]|jgi:dihydrofolate reductase|uniref:dihydrofolate reductase family protein n=1 Tax=Microbacterium sp. ARD31 TaxID=2962576 RepID=UPI002881F0FB|nr:dihydrofolate reductase family protein [Microbacterium sp. ARD31]MDT0180443.1 dihydrofolate reductase family protein [Microbacterium sp. ARD31]